MNRKLVGWLGVVMVGLLMGAACKSAPERPLQERRDEILDHRDRLKTTGQLDAAAREYMDKALADKDFTVRAKVGALIKIAVDKGAMSKSDALQKLDQVIKDTVDREELDYWNTVRTGVAAAP